MCLDEKWRVQRAMKVT